MADNRRLTSVSMQVDDVAEKRLWKALDTILEQISDIKSKLEDVVRIDERVNNHEKILASYGNSLADHENRIRHSEMRIAESGDRGSIGQMLSNLQGEVREVREAMNETAKDLEEDIKELEKIVSKTEGEKGISKSVLKWAVGILTSIVLLFVAGAIK